MGLYLICADLSYHSCMVDVGGGVVADRLVQDGAELALMKRHRCRPQANGDVHELRGVGKLLGAARRARITLRARDNQ